jgi:hypothetical protein
MIEYAERAYSRAMKLAEVLVKSRSEEEAREEAKSLIALCDRCGREMRPGNKNPFGYVGEQFAEHLGPAGARYLESKVDVIAAEEALRTALFRICHQAFSRAADLAVLQVTWHSNPKVIRNTRRTCCPPRPCRDRSRSAGR